MLDRVITLRVKTLVWIVTTTVMLTLAYAANVWQIAALRGQVRELRERVEIVESR